MVCSQYFFLLICALIIYSVRMDADNEVVSSGNSSPLPKYPFVSDKDREVFAASQYPETADLLDQYDFVIVGAGSAGCVLANRLSEISNWTVLLIEAGDYETRDMDVPAKALDLQNTKADWNYLTEPSDQYSWAFENNQINYPRGKVVGGSSVLNLMIYTRGNVRDYDKWENVYLNKGWSFQSVEKYFRKLEDYLVQNDTFGYFGNNGPMYIQTSNYHSNLSTALLNAVEQYGFPIINVNGPSQSGFDRLQTTIKGGYRFSTNSGYLLPIKNKRPNLYLKINCQVTKIIIENMTAKGVHLACESGKNYTVYAKKEVVLSAGAINSPQLLMLSGVGDRKHLKEVGIPLIKHLPVGNNLMDHIFMAGLEFTVNQTVFPKEDIFGLWVQKSGPLSLPGVVEVYGFTKLCNHIRLCSSDPLVEQAFMSFPLTRTYAKKLRLNSSIYKTFYEPFDNNSGYIVLTVLQKPKSRGWVRLVDDKPFSKPKIYPNFFSHPDDIEKLMLGVKEMIAVSKMPALQAWGAQLLNVSFPLCSQFTYGSDDYLRCSIRATTTTLYHPAGTCKMGPRSDPTAVVDSELKVHGIKGLRVIDASIMPEIITGHLNGPVIMIGEKGADMIKEFWGAKYAYND